MATTIKSSEGWPLRWNVFCCIEFVWSLTLILFRWTGWPWTLFPLLRSLWRWWWICTGSAPSIQSLYRLMFSRKSFRFVKQGRKETYHKWISKSFRFVNREQEKKKHAQPMNQCWNPQVFYLLPMLEPTGFLSFTLLSAMYGIEYVWVPTMYWNKSLK